MEWVLRFLLDLVESALGMVDGRPGRQQQQAWNSLNKKHGSGTNLAALTEVLPPHHQHPHLLHHQQQQPQPPLHSRTHIGNGVHPPTSVTVVPLLSHAHPHPWLQHRKKHEDVAPDTAAILRRHSSSHPSPQQPSPTALPAPQLVGRSAGSAASCEDTTTTRIRRGSNSCAKTPLSVSSFDLGREDDDLESGVEVVLELQETKAATTLGQNYIHHHQKQHQQQYDCNSEIATRNRGIRGSQPIVQLNRLQLLAGKSSSSSSSFSSSVASSSIVPVTTTVQETTPGLDNYHLLPAEPDNHNHNHDDGRYHHHLHQSRDSSLLPVIAYQDLLGLTDPINRLGGGAFGLVFRATWHGTPVAVKTLSLVEHNISQQQQQPQQQGNDLPVTVLSAFEEEVSMLARLRHPNICLLLGVCLEPFHKAIVTELVSKGSLWDVLRTKQSFQVSVCCSVAVVFDA
jgi:hypothetical protein